MQENSEKETDKNPNFGERIMKYYRSLLFAFILTTIFNVTQVLAGAGGGGSGGDGSGGGGGSGEGSSGEAGLRALADQFTSDPKPFIFLAAAILFVAIIHKNKRRGILS